MLDLIKAISLGLVVLLPLANPLTTVALFLGLAGNMNSAERNHQSMMASVCRLPCRARRGRGPSR